MAQPALRTAPSRSRLGRTGMSSSRSNERIQGAENAVVQPQQSGSNVLRNKVSRTVMGGGVAERRRPALGDKTNIQNSTVAAQQQNGGTEKDHTLKHKLPSSSSLQATNSSSSNSTNITISNAAATVRREGGVANTSNAKQRPLSAVAATSSKFVAEKSTLTASNSYAGNRHLRGNSSSSGTNLSRHSSDVNMSDESSAATTSSQRSSMISTASSSTVAPRRASQTSRRQLSNRPMETDESADTVPDASNDLSGTTLVSQGELHLVRPRELLHVRAPSSGTSADEDMSEAESDWQSSSIEGGAFSSKTDTDDEEEVEARKAAGSALASSDEELVDDDGEDDEEDEEDEDVSETESDLLNSLDPECLVSLPYGLDELAREKVEQICARYEAQVLLPAVARQNQERAEAFARGEIPADVAAHEEELALMGLDPDEVRDTSMVAEYSKEIFEYMSKCESRTMANPKYMDFQGEIRWHMRATLVDWLMQVHMRYHLTPETLFIAINVVDRFLSARVVSLAKLQLVGVTAMFIAAKYEEILAPGVDEFVFMTESGYTREEILKGERIILSTLDFNISGYCSPYSWVRKISKADDYDIQTRTLAKFLMELTLFDHRFLRAKPSLIAAVAMYLSKKMLGGAWTDAFVYYSRLSEEQLIPGANLLLERLVDESFRDSFVCKKYSNRKFLKASIFARDWAVRNQETMLVPSESVSSSIGTSMSAIQSSDMQPSEYAAPGHPSASAPMY